MTDHRLNQENRILWEKTIKKLLGDKNPCLKCIVRPKCTKSILDNTACEELGNALKETLNTYEIKT